MKGGDDAIAPQTSRRWLSFAAQLAISIALVSILVTRADLGDVRQRLASANHIWSALALAFILAQTPIVACRFNTVLRRLKVDFSFGRGVSVQWGAQLMSQVVPTVGGDAWRIVCVKRAGGSLATAIEAVIIDRIAALGGVISISLAMLPRAFSHDVARRWSMLLLAVFAAAGLGLAALTSADRWLPRYALVRKFRDVAPRVRSTLFSTRSGAQIWAYSLVVPIMSSCAVYFSARALTIDVGLLDCLLLVPSILLLAALPVSIAGWGVREGSAVALFSMIGAGFDEALLLSLALGALQLCAALPGAVAVVRGR